MIGKKLFGVIMSLSLAFGIAAPSFSVQAKPVVPTTKYEVSVDRFFAPPNVEKIIEGLRKEGKIPQGATKEEIDKIVKEYLKKHDPANSKKNAYESKKLEKIFENIKNYKMPEASKETKKKMKENLAKADIDYVQAEEWDGGMHVAKPLVVLMEFPDYTHEKMNEEVDSDRMFKDWSKKHYQEMLFNPETFNGMVGNDNDFITMRKWYEEQSGGSYSLQGDVYGWYMAEKSYKHYGGDNGDDIDPNVQDLVKEALAKVAADPNIDLSQYDIEDRDDFDNDGNKHEPDGIIDHLIVIHASIGQEEWGGSLGNDAIWAHQSTVNDGFTDEGKEIPYKFTDSKGKVWQTKEYTMDPQDGSVGVFCHEYGHDLGLPDEYDTIYSGDGDPVERWAVMSGGSYNGKVSGTEPVGFSPWCKQVLQNLHGGNWINGTTVNIDDITAEGLDFLIDEASTKGTNNDVVRIDLPEKKHVITKPTSGEFAYYSGKGNGLNESLVAAVDLAGKESGMLKFKTWYQIEEGWDYASVKVKGEGLDEWVTIPGNITTVENPNKQNPGFGITGHSDGWIDAAFDLSSYAGQKIELKINYWTDPAAVETGIFVDDIKVEADGQVILSDNADGDDVFALEGFKKNVGYEMAGQYYLLEWRNCTGVDKGLANAWGGITYDPGLVVWYVDEYYDNNWTGIHPGEGFNGVVDADQEITMYKYDDAAKADKRASSSIQLHDAAFSLRRSLVLDYYSNYYKRSAKDTDTFMNPFFDDSRNYLNEGFVDVGRNVPNLGLKIYVTGESKDRTVGKIHISK